MLFRKLSLGLVKKVHSSKDLKETRELTMQIIWVPVKVPEFDKVSVAGMEWMKWVTGDRVGPLWGLEGQCVDFFTLVQQEPLQVQGEEQQHLAFLFLF